MKKFVNSPIVITVIVIAAAAIMFHSSRYNAAASVRNVYNEIIAIANDSSSDAEQAKAVRDFAQTMSKNLRAGFSSGFQNPNKDKIDEEAKTWLETKKSIVIGDIKRMPSAWSNQEAYACSIQNNSDKYLSSLRVNAEYYKNGELHAFKDEWLSNIKILEPGEKVNCIIKRQTASSGNSNKDMPAEDKSDEVKIYMTNFQIKKITQDAVKDK